MTLDTRLLMDDVSLAKGLLENAAANDGKLSPSDIVFGLRNLLKMKYYRSLHQLRIILTIPWLSPLYNKLKIKSL